MIFAEVIDRRLDADLALIAIALFIICFALNRIARAVEKLKA